MQPGASLKKGSKGSGSQSPCTGLVPHAPPAVSGGAGRAAREGSARPLGGQECGRPAALATPSTRPGGPPHPSGSRGGELQATPGT